MNRLVPLLVVLPTVLVLGACTGTRPQRPLFEFHSGFWLNLHQDLHYAATGRRRPPPTRSEPEWKAAVDAYRSRFGERGGMGIIFDDELVALNRRLSLLASARELRGVAPEVARPLASIAEASRRDWPAQDRKNRAWIAALAPALERHGEALRAALTAAYGAEWPATPIRVDVARYAGPVGAYTVLDPTHITIASGEPRLWGDAALEMIFHEASHALVDPIEQQLEREAKKRGKSAPRDLWHALLFYTTGEIVKRRLGKGYVPYATKHDLWSRGWSDFEVALGRHWQPYLEGRVDRATAIRELIDNLDQGETAMDTHEGGEATPDNAGADQVPLFKRIQ
jgi:hypothetical protein